MKIIGENLILKFFTIEEYQELFKKYVPDPIIDPNPYTIMTNVSIETLI